jgi:predicted phage terminase large subunit-like protein
LRSTLIKELNVDECHGVTSYKPECDKIMRLHAQTATIESGFVFVPETAPWLAEYLHEMTVFPKGEHDDQVDSTAQFLASSARSPRERSAAKGELELLRRSSSSACIR